MMSANRQQSNDRLKDYIPVAERIEKFYEKFPTGKINTQILEHNIETGFVMIRAEIYREAEDTLPAATGHAFEVRGDSFVNKTSYVENAETSAVGRGLALLGFEIKRGIASKEEMEKVERSEPSGPRPVPATANRDKDVMTALEILGKSEDWLNVQMQKRWPEVKAKDWSDLGAAHKHELWLGLNKLINEKAAAR
jgi:hypothetical protein